MLLVRTVVLFLLGISIGSFINVLIDRVPYNLSILGRSHCDHCKHKLGVLDLIPLLSFIILNGRCRYCKAKINPRNFIVEATLGTLFVFVFIYYSSVLSLEFFYSLFILSSLITIFFIDLKHQIIPDKITYPAILISLLFVILNHQSSVFNYIFSAIGASVFFLILFILTKGKGLGFGDVKLAALMGLFLGFPKIIIAIYSAFLTGAIFGLILILWKKKGLKDKIAFGPFLVAGTILSFFLGDHLASLWSNFL